MSTIAPDNASITYSPYTWHVTAARAKTIDAGAYISIAFTGSTAGLAALFTLTGTSTLPVIEYRVDHGPWTMATLAASVPLTAPATVVGPKHVVDIRVNSTGGATDRWTTQNSAVQFAGLTATGTITPFLQQRPSKRIFALGDSLLEGVATNGVTAAAPATPHNAVSGWGYPLAELLGAEVGISGFGGVGLTKPGPDGVPAFGTIWDKLWDGAARDFTSAPDLIVNNVGTNDGTNVTALATALLDAQLAATPTSTRIALVQTWNNIQTANLQAAIPLCSDPARVTWINTAGWFDTADSHDGIHPYGYSNLTNLAPRLANALRPLLGDTVTSTGAEFIWNGTVWESI